jgi:CRP/FNR family transcriptional regulator, cyclic AMP receptor protein
MTSKFSRTCCSEQTLASFEIFQSLPDEAVQAYSKRCFWRRFAKNETLIEYNDTTRDVYFISSGRARATYYAACGREISFRDLDPGEMFGEIAAIDALPRSVSVTALTDMLVAVMPSAVFRELLCQHDQSSTAMMLRLAMLIRRLSERVVELSALGVQHRIHAELLRLARKSSPGQNTAVVFPVPTHTDIANRISTHREAVTKELGNLRRAGLLERRSGILIIPDVEKLSRMVSEILREWRAVRIALIDRRDRVLAMVEKLIWSAVAFEYIASNQAVAGHVLASDWAATGFARGHRSLKQVLINLLGKAAKFTPEGRCIHVAASMAAGSLEIVIRDTVIGILGSTTMSGHPPSSGVNIDATPPRAAARNACETIRSMRDQRR